MPRRFFHNLSFVVLTRQEVPVNKGNSNSTGFGPISFHMWVSQPLKKLILLRPGAPLTSPLGPPSKPSVILAMSFLSCSGCPLLLEDA